MRKFVALCLIVALLVVSVCLTGCSSKSREEELLEELFDGYNRDAVNDLRAGQAKREGDTFCKSCLKTMEGIHKYCTFCGERIR